MTILLSSAVSAQFKGLSHRVPADANVLVLINPEKVFSAPVAVREDWKGQQRQNFAAGTHVIPPQAKQFLLAAHMDVAFMHPLWEVALLNLVEDANLAVVAARHHGQIDNLDAKPAAVLPSDVYVVELNKRLLAAMRPANRQNVARWLRETSTTSKDRQLSAYLQQALEYADKGGTPIIMAIDLEHVLSAHDVRLRLESSDLLKQRSVDLDQLSEQLASLHGVTLGITVGERIFGALKVDFDQPIDSVHGMGKQLLLAALGNHGLMIDEFEEWEVHEGSHQIKLEGPLQASGLRRILSLVNTPSAMQSALESEYTSPGEQAEADAQQLTLLASQQYFQSVEGLVEDLTKRKNMKTMGQVGKWFGRYAQRIDQLPLLNVDPELLDFGGYVSNALRQAETALRDEGGTARVRALNAPPEYDVYAGYSRWTGYGAYGGAVAYEDWKAEMQTRSHIRTEERVSTAKSARDIMQNIEQATADVRRQMVQKYQAEF